MKNNTFALIPEGEDKLYGGVKPVEVIDGQVCYGLSIGGWAVSHLDGNIHIVLREDIDAIIHETATRRGVNAELRQAEKDAKGVEKKPTIVLDPRTKRFKEEYL